VLPVAAILVLASAGCTLSGINFPVGLAGSGRLVDKEYELADFSRVDVGFGFHLTLTQDAAYRTTITVDDNLVDYLLVEKRGDSLYIGLKNGAYRNVTLRADVTVPALRGLSLSGGTQATMSGFRSADDFTLDASGGSSLTGDIDAGNVTITASGGSRVTLRGAGQALRIDASGGSPSDLGDFTCTDATVTLSGGSKTTINASGRLDADLSGGSSLNYRGSPTLGRVNSSGGSQINRQ